MINYKWIISALDVAQKEGELEKVVKTVHWRYRGVDDSDSNLTYELYGAYPIEMYNFTQFTPYENLTEENVIGWLISKLDVTSLEKTISDNIELLRNPPIFTEVNPFAPKEEPKPVEIKQ